MIICSTDSSTWWSSSSIVWATLSGVGQTPCCGQRSLALYSLFSRLRLSGRPFFCALSSVIVQVTKLWENTTVGGQKGLFSSSSSVCTHIYTSHPLNNHKKKEKEKRFMVFQRLIAEAVEDLKEKKKKEKPPPPMIIVSFPTLYGARQHSSQSLYTAPIDHQQAAAAQAKKKEKKKKIWRAGTQ